MFKLRCNNCGTIFEVPEDTPEELLEEAEELFCPECGALTEDDTYKPLNFN